MRGNGNPMAKEVKVLMLRGLPDTNTIEMAFLSRDINRLKFKVNGNIYLDFLNNDFLVREIWLGAVPGDPPAVEQPHVIVNSICDPDSNMKSLKIAEAVVGQLGMRVINHPTQVASTHRHQIAELLRGIKNVKVPLTIRITPQSIAEVMEGAEAAGIQMPLLFREAGAHGGEQLALLENHDCLKMLERFPLDGRGYYLTEFVDFRSADGLYRKHRFFIVDGEIYPRHLIISDHWKVHAASRARLMGKDKRYNIEEEAFLNAFSQGGEAIRHVFHEIHKRLGLDLFGVDCTIDEQGQLTIFEVNCSFRLEASGDGGKPGSDQYHLPHVNRIKEAVRQMVLRQCKN